MHSSRKYNYPYPPHGWSLEISREWEVSKANILNIFEARREFPGGWGFKTMGEGMDIFWNHAISSAIFPRHNLEKTLKTVIQLFQFAFHFDPHH